jgi:hypothetical protein
LFDNMDETKISNKKISHVNEFLKIKKNLVWKQKIDEFLFLFFCHYLLVNLFLG